MAVLTLRSVKGTRLTNTEIDNNFSNLNTELGTKLDSSSYTASDVLAKLLTVDGSGSGLNADLLDGLQTSSTNVVSTVVVRDASGNFSAGTITANLVGNVTGTVTGNATNVTGTVAVVNGGTGGTTILEAQTNLQVDPAGLSLALAIALG